jgi:hypothetical protein
MLLDKAQQIKAKLLYFEGKTVDSRAIWKVMLCPRSHAPESLIEQCRQDFGYDDIFSALNYREDIDIYIVYREGDTFSFERHEEFTGKASL